MSEEQKRLLQQQLWAIANTLRGKMNADEFKDYMLGFIFYKYLSEKMEHAANEALKADDIVYMDLLDNQLFSSEDRKLYIQEIKKNTQGHIGFFLEPQALFKSVAAKAQLDEGDEDKDNFVIDELARIFGDIEQSTVGTDSADDFIHLFEDLDLTSSKLGKSPSEQNAVIATILSHLDKIDFDLSNTEADVLGDAYEYLIGEFASGAGKKAGEFYTPQPVSMLLSRLVTLNRGEIKTAYDPTCGSGSLLLRVKRELNGKQKYPIKIYGQELNRTTFNLARMNMILHDVHHDNFSIRQDDTLEKPQHLDLKFDAIVANPPFSAQWSANSLFLDDERFKRYGKLAPSSKADMAFIQHMLYQLAEDGVMAVVMPHGVLFRGGAEGTIRKYLIEEMNCLDAVIGLPEKIFFGTSIPTCVLVFKHCRKDPDNILFIDASNEYDKGKNQNILHEKYIDRIVETYGSRSSIEKYSRVALLSEVKANDYNLNIPRYVDTFETEAQIDLDAVALEIQQIDSKMVEVDKTIADFCQQLGIKTPF